MKSHVQPYSCLVDRSDVKTALQSDHTTPLCVYGAVTLSRSVYWLCSSVRSDGGGGGEGDGRTKGYFGASAQEIASLVHT